MILDQKVTLFECSNKSSKRAEYSANSSKAHLIIQFIVIFKLVFGTA